MRPLLFVFALLSISAVATAQDLATFDAKAGDVSAFDESLQEYMTRSGNKAAKDAYANFNGVFFGGAFTEEQQRRIMTTAVGMAGARVNATGGFINFLKAFDGFPATPEGEEENPLFDSFLTGVDQMLADPDTRTNDITNALGRAEIFLNEGKLVRNDDDTGWRITGGDPVFRYEGKLLLAIDTVRALTAIGKNDTLNVQQTSLLIDLAANRVTGKGGRVDWARVGLEGEVFAILVEYEVDGNRMILQADSAQFQYPEYFDDRILMGKFADKVRAGGPRESGEYPQFLSSDGFVEIKNIGKNINLFGNFELRGNTVYAIGRRGRQARVRLRIQGSATDRSIEGEADRFSVRAGESVGGASVRTVVRVGPDSLFHPSVTMFVKIPERIVGLRRTDSSADRAPFYHSKNGVAIYTDYLDIHLEGDSAVLGKRTVSFQEKPDVVFESEDYYSEREYLFVQDISATNPLERIYAYRQNMNGGLDDFHADDLAQAFGERYTKEDIKTLLFDLQTRGFLLYDTEDDMVYLKPKLVHYVEASREEIDYDKLRVVSRTTNTNGVMDLVTGDIRINEVLPLEFNRAKQIALRPAGSQLILRNNRDLDFSGQVYAGGIVMTGKDFHFKYDPYHIQLDSVRYIDLFLPKDDNLEPGAERLSAGSRIEHFSGYLLIDAPKNKSGTENIPYFPSLQSKGKSYIYYDQADTSAAYGRDDFYFELEPFSLNGTDSLLGSEIALQGELNSGGIFPDFDETLSIQEDGSLGFTTDTPEGGQATYEGRGNYEGEIVLNNRGLEGNGKLTYLEANIVSEDIKFGLTKTTASAEAFELEESSESGRVVPQVRGTAVNVEFKPYGDSLVVNAVEDAPFALFKTDGYRLDGGLVLTPEALKGNGTLDWSSASLTSEDMDFSLFGARADTASVSIKSLEAGDKLALTTSNVQAEVDFETQQASFSNNSTDLSTELPYNRFRTSIDEFDWDMAGGSVAFKAQPGKDRFTSTHPDQDSLTFTGESATFDINTSMLEVAGVPYIAVADARIYPGEGKVRVEGEAKITELTDARIVADTINEYHVINRATVTIDGRKEYRASGFYEYNVGPHTQEVEFQEIVGTRVGKGKREEKATATRAEGQVGEDQNFFVDHKTNFFGTINLDAGSETLFFEGYAKINADKLPDAQWFTVSSEGDKNDLTLAVREPKDRDGLPLFTGLYLSKPQRGIYPSLVQTLDFRKDQAILDANGLMNYDEENDVFLFGDSLRLYDPESTTGNLLRFDNRNGKLSGDGKLGLGARLQYISVASYGNIAMDMPTGQRRAPEPDFIPEPEEEEVKEEAPASPPSMFLLEEETVAKEDTATEKSVTLTIDAPVEPSRPEVSVNAMMLIDLIFPDKLVNLMATDVLSGTYASPGLQLQKDLDFYRTGIETLFPKSAQREIAVATLEGGVFDVGRDINEHTFVFPKLEMRWSDDYQSFVTTKKQNALASIRGNTISKMVEVHVEVKMPSGGDDRLYIYVKSPSEQYYFFGFKDGILNVVSNNTQFMNELDNMKAKELVLKMDDGQTYEILPVSPSTAETFLRRVRDAF